MIYLEDVSRYFVTKQGRRYVFKNVTAAIPCDKSVAILGPNGAGKSTLVRMLGGADSPNKGKISSDENVSWPLGLQGGLQGSMTGRENVRFVARIHGVKDTRQIEQQVEDFAEIGSYFDEPVKSYSNGMRARVAFGLTMGFDFDFDVLLIDELTAVGDARFKKKSEAILQQKYKKTKVFMVNHSVEQLKKFCEAAIVIENAGITYYENLADGLERYRSLYDNA
ncbi:ABC transporter ATP-binding protein [Bacterioplanoides sp. SCSIO 12839]|uniref:ABC transporter ATP-binding protein n=1 Tax=Bacterioplanoides sp. SCSIO 12839 TaxID=2829569 RepID=UPI002106433C|nr:ABC transporter ATP-binding protein [Bacterioplanoides sp. SCSIO 12839]UTW47839.1 ABC transporter ATP-binding protein [Bacterioplanoides sp. SCSIO 12839]